MRRFFLALSAFFICFFLLAFSVNASLLVVDSQGRVIWKVLSSQDPLSLGIPQRDYLEVKDITGNSGIFSEAKISLKREDDKMSLSVTTEEGEKNLDVTGWQDDLVEIEERSETQRLTIAIVGEKFAIEQKGVLALTDYPININPANKELSVSTPSGARFLSLLPHEAVEAALRARVISRLPSGENLQLLEEGRGELSYLISGERVINIFNILDYSVPVKAHVSALTGEVLLVEQPTWLKIFGFLFV